MCNDSVFTVQEAALYMKISKKTLYPLLRDSKIAAAKVGSDWRILKKSIDEYLGNK